PVSLISPYKVDSQDGKPAARVVVQLKGAATPDISQTPNSIQIALSGGASPASASSDDSASDASSADTPDSPPDANVPAVPPAANAAGSNSSAPPSASASDSADQDPATQKLKKFMEARET